MARGNYTNKVAQNVAEFTEEETQQFMRRDMNGIETSNTTHDTRNSDKSDKVVISEGATSYSDTAKKSGRPSKGDVHKVSLAIPVELYEGVEFGSFFFKGNKTAYINNLIRKDLEKNLSKYREFKAMMETQ